MLITGVSSQVLGVRVEILDINDHTPTFPDRKWMYQISEAAEPGTEFVIPSAVDLDGYSRSNGIRLYSLDHTPIDGVDKFDLKIVQQVGRGGGGGGGGGGAGGFRQPSVAQAPAAELGPHHVLKLVLRENLDRERTSSHIVVVSAVDGGSPPKTGSMIVVVEVIDANDNRPEFTQQTYEVNSLSGCRCGVCCNNRTL